MQRGRVLAEPDTGTEALFIATVLNVRSYLHVLPFMRLSSRVFKQLDETPGCLRWAVIAEPWRRRFYTFTAWKDRASMAAFVKAEPHAEAVRMMDRWAGHGSAFTEWTGTDPPARLSEIKDRLKTPTFMYGGARG